LRQHEAIFHDVGNVDTCCQADDAGGTLERVRGAHAGLELIGRRRILFEFQQTYAEYMGLAFRLLAE